MTDGYLRRIAQSEDLDFEESRDMMLKLGRGEYSPEQVAAILTALKVKGETVSEISGCASAFRELAVPLPHSVTPVVFDCCGTGGDGAGTINISTAAAIVTAAVGVPTAKHGNRAVSSKSGSTDVLEALGVRIDMSPTDAATCLEETDFCFLFAPHYHPAMKHVAPVRKSIGIPTLFNILGPLLNPAGCTHQIIGTTDAGKAQLISQVAAGMGLENVTAFFSESGHDEAVEGATCHLYRTNGNGTEGRELFVTGNGTGDLSQLTGGDAQENAEILRKIFQGENSLRSRTVVLNAALGLVETGRYAGLESAQLACREALESGRVLAKLNEVVAFTNRSN